MAYVLRKDGTSIHGIARSINRPYTTVRDWLVRAALLHNSPWQNTSHYPAGHPVRQPAEAISRTNLLYSPILGISSTVIMFSLFLDLTAYPNIHLREEKTDSTSTSFHSLRCTRLRLPCSQAWKCFGLVKFTPARREG